MKNIQKARELIKERKDGYTCQGTLYDRFHHNDPRFRLKEYMRVESDGILRAQEGFMLAEDVKITMDDLVAPGTDYVITAYSTKTGREENVVIDANSIYAILDRKLKSTAVWKNYHFIDTDTGEEKTGLYLETLAEYHMQAKELLGDKDQHGMKLNGLIILLNGMEPGKGTVTLHDYVLNQTDLFAKFGGELLLQPVYKNDQALYDSSVMQRAA